MKAARDAYVRLLNESRGATAKGEKHSYEGPGANPYTEYDKPITRTDVQTLRSIGQKSINDFTAEDLKKAQKWAHKIFAELEANEKVSGVKSPFFRAWFGEWRANEKTPIVVVDIKSDTRGGHANKDTGWEITRSAKVSREWHDSQASISGRAFLPYIDGIIENSVLFDTVVSDNDNANSLFFHSFYAVLYHDGTRSIVKLFVEEQENPSKGTDRRAYKLVDIKMYRPSTVVSPKLNSLLKVGTDIRVADLYAIVKTFDKYFVAGKDVNPALLNEDGTPKVFYHGTDTRFDAFDPAQLSPREGDGGCGETAAKSFSGGKRRGIFHFFVFFVRGG